MRIIIQAVNGKTAAMAFAETSVDAAPGGSYLFISGAGADRMVRSLNLLQLGHLLVYERERENSVCHLLADGASANLEEVRLREAR